MWNQCNSSVFLAYEHNSNTIFVNWIFFKRMRDEKDSIMMEYKS